MFCNELQVMRGIAAFIVLMSHSVIFIVGGFSPGYEAILPFVNAGAAVNFFFVLSGFVLALSLTRSPMTPMRLTSFYIRRGFRIYPALIGVVALAVLILNVIVDFQAMTAAGLTGHYTHEVSASKAILAAAGGLSAQPVPPIWSIFAELVGSALLPILLLLSRGVASKIAIFVALTLISFLIGLDTHYAVAVYFVHFYLGASLLWWGPKLFEAMRARWITWLFGLVAVIVLLGGRQVIGLGHHHPLPSFVDALSSVALIGVVYYKRAQFADWAGGVLNYLGEISYSLYLVHFPLAVLVSHGFFATTGMTMLADLGIGGILLWLAAYVTISIVTASIFYYVLEKPGIIIGRWLLKGVAAITQRADKPAAAE